MANWSTPSAHQFSLLNQFASSSNHNSTMRSQKRRLDSEDGSENSQEHMDRSPTPDRPKRAIVKRARTSPTSSEMSLRDDRRPKDERSSTSEQDVDIGVLLARLPPHSLLPILTNLVEKHPSLKNEVLLLIPPPTLETAVQELVAAGRKLRDAYPHSNATQPNPLGFGFAFGSASSSLHSTMSGPHHSTGMRDEYILSRIRPVLAEFVSAFSTYMPYFSYVQNHATHSMQSQTSRPQSHLTEAFRFLSVVVEQISSQPLLVQSALESDLRDRLTVEWNGWMHKLDTIVNNEGGMFGSDTATGWIRHIEQYAVTDRQSPWITTLYKNLRGIFVMKVGWLAQRQPVYRMEES
ncbi:hypothetical protein D9758_000360 [Tetrapyrgos nigripes]|uniref:Tethering factor for nuclear proteasome STS1 n=1 Tax=Tetrapyrgos nigripes TaxID=182062 RepID=A0A8H5H1L4_9AGAR|nr:hypothetical protein D9758_000360 [Tetrapyrgos nigripes]